MADGPDDESMDDDHTKPVHAKSLEHAKKPKSKPTVKTRRGYGRKNGKRNKKGKELCFSLIGTNAAGLNPKRESFYNLINKFLPSVVTIQETKLTKTGLVKIPGYQIFEKIRKNKKGGGLLTAADDDLNPVLISSGSDENEILTIQADLGQSKIRIINAYGPQEDDGSQRTLGFWQEIESEIMNAKDNDCLVIVELDANAKVGKDVIKDDPNQSSNNGKVMLDVLQRQNLHIANASDVCEGTITRERVSGEKSEKSIIDYILICEKMKKFLTKMTIDDSRSYVLSRYLKTKNGRKIITSDHNVLMGKFSVKFERKPRQIRKEFFNFKCQESKQKFQEETSNSNKLSSCFDDPDDFRKNTFRFFRVLKGTFQKCFSKIRIKTGNEKVIGNQSMQAKLKLKTEIKEFISKNSCKIGQQIAKSKLDEIERDLEDETAKENADKVKKYLESVETLDGNFSNVGFWKMKQKLWPSSCDPPMAKHDREGNLVTAPGALKNLYLETYRDRLKHRDMNPDLMDVYFLKMELWMSRLSNIKKIKTLPWDYEKLDTVLKGLKNNKSMDPNGMVNEVFKSGCIGSDMRKALSQLLNGTKKEQWIPIFMALSNITTIYKSKGSRFDLNNDRGIFILTVLKKILDKLIYLDNYKELDENMSDSNVGARRKRNIKDHLLVIYGIINSVIRGGEECIDIQIYDIEKAFDAMWLEDSLNDVYDTLPEDKRNDELSLLYESNKVNMVAVKTAAGMTDRVDIPCIVQQGGTWGSMLCSNSIDTIGKKCRNRGEHVYLYKKTARILPLAFVDDLNGISKCGVESRALNIFLTTQIELKKLKFHVPDKFGKTKCHKMHIGRKKQELPNTKSSWYCNARGYRRCLSWRHFKLRW